MSAGGRCAATRPHVPGQAVGSLPGSSTVQSASSIRRWRCQNSQASVRTVAGPDEGVMVLSFIGPAACARPARADRRLAVPAGQPGPASRHTELPFGRDADGGYGSCPAAGGHHGARPGTHGPRGRQHLARSTSNPSGASDSVLSPVTVLTSAPHEPAIWVPRHDHEVAAGCPPHAAASMPTRNEVAPGPPSGSTITFTA